MISHELNQKIYAVILKKRKKSFHIFLTLLTFGIWAIFYWLIRLSYSYNMKYAQKLNNWNNNFNEKLKKQNQEFGKKQLDKIELINKKQGALITSYGVEGNNPYTKAVPHSIYANAYVDRKQSVPVEDYVVFDTETTGLEPEIDKIIEISAIKYINNEPVDTFTTLVNPKQKLDPFITKLTGIKNFDLIKSPTINNVLPGFFDFIEDYVLVAHNAPFDIKMIACECYRNNIEMCNNKLIDTLPLARRMISNNDIRDYKLSTLKDYFGIELKSHRATEDCEMCNIVYQHYLRFSKIKNKKKQIIIIDKETGEVLQEN